MGKSTLVKHKNQTIVDLGRTVNNEILLAREENLIEAKESLREYLMKQMVAYAAYNPSKDELHEIINEVEDLIDYAIESSEELGVARILQQLANEKDIKIELL